MFTPRSGGLPIRNLGGSGGPGTGRSTGSNDPKQPVAAPQSRRSTAELSAPCAGAITGHFSVHGCAPAIC
jgi:hypothetical protein